MLSAPIGHVRSGVYMLIGILQLSVKTKLSYHGLIAAFDVPKPEQNGCHFVGNVLKYISLKDFLFNSDFFLISWIQLTINQHWFK